MEISKQIQITNLVIPSDGTETGEDNFGSQRMSGREITENLTGELGSWDGIAIRREVQGRVEFWLNDRCLGSLVSHSGDRVTVELNIPAEPGSERLLPGVVRQRAGARGEDTGRVSVPLHTVAETAFAIQLLEYCYDLVMNKSIPS